MSRAQVPIQPPPWGPMRDPHFASTHDSEAFGCHTQVDVETAVFKGWWFRPNWYSRLRPDTRRCRFHGEIMYEELPLSQADLDIMYADQNRGMSTGPL